ncbi:MAG: DMT family transporter [Methylobacteriaceae bacterium]|nr:DMT family transporter [Methylobacteriaceae bacterium]
MRALIRSRPSAGIAFMLLAVFFFAVNDALGKYVLATYSVGQMMLVRSITGLCIILPLLVGTRASPIPQTGALWLHLVRGMLATAEAAFFFSALTMLPLAEVTTYYLAGPIYVTALSPWLLREHVGWRRWSGVLAGFCGVVLALHPSGGAFNIGSLSALIGSFAYACFMITTRRVGETPAPVLLLWQFGVALVFGCGATIVQGWRPPNAAGLALLVSLGVGSLLGHFSINMALRFAAASVVVPYQYTMIVWGVLFGWRIFGELVDVQTLIGAAIIIAAGLYIFLRERRVAISAEEMALPE